MTGPAILVSVSVRMAAAAAALLALALVLGCGDSEEDVAPDPSVTPTASGTTPPVITVSPTAVPDTPVPVPSDWKTYTNPDLGFSVAYPPDLEVVEVPHQTWPTPLPPGGLESWDFEFKSKEYGFSLSVYVAGTEAYTTDQFADENCPLDKREALLGGYPATRCKAYTPIKDVWASVVVAGHNGWFHVISAAYWPDETQLEAMFQSFRFVN